MSLLDRAKFAASSWIKTNPRRMQFVWRMLTTFRFLLPHEKDYLGLKKFNFGADKLILDVGANTGLSALGFHAIGFRGEILSIEPNRLLKPHLERARRLIPRFNYKLLAAGSKADTMTLFTPKYKGVAVHVLASLRLDYAKMMVSRDYPAKIAAQTTYDEQEIEIIRLDDLNTTPALIKFDCEGFDLEAIKGLHDTITEHNPVLLIEYTPGTFNAIAEFIGPLGYLTFRYDQKADAFAPFNEEDAATIWKRDGLQVNVFCVPPAPRHPDSAVKTGGHHPPSWKPSTRYGAIDVRNFNPS